MSNVIQIRDPQGNAVYPITDASLVIGLQDGPFSEYILSWDGSSTPVVANIPAGVSVVYGSTTYTGTLAASSSTACKVYLVASTSQVGEYDRYITSHTSSVYSWTPLASTQIQSPVVVDNLMTNDPTKALSAKQGKVLNEEVSQLGQEVIYDVTMNNPTAGPNNDGKFESLSALLSDENLSTLIPSTVRCGGMSIRFIQTSDNNYVQFRLMSDSFSTTEANWQGVDDVPTAGSDNLVKSGGVIALLIDNSIEENILIPSSNRGKYINISNIGDTINITPISNSGFEYIIIPIKKNDFVSVKGDGAGAPRLWAFTDINYILLRKSEDDAHIEEPIILQATADGYFISNGKISTGSLEHIVCKYQLLPDLKKELDENSFSTYKANLENFNTGVKINLPSDFDNSGIDAGGEWSFIGDKNYLHRLLYVKAGSNIILTTNSNRQTQYALISLNSIPRNLENITYVDGITRTTLSYNSTITLNPTIDCYLYLLEKYSNQPAYGLPQVSINNTNPFELELPPEMLPKGILRFDSQNSKFEFYSYRKGNEYYGFFVEHVIDNTPIVYKDLWQLTTGALYTYNGQDFTKVADTIDAPENEMAIHFKNKRDYTGGYHGDERIDVDNNSFVKFFADGTELSINSGDFEIECNTFSYLEYSTLHETTNDGTTPIEGHPIVAYHTKKVLFENCSHVVENYIEMVGTQIVDQAHAGLICIDKEAATFAFLPNNVLTPELTGTNNLYDASDKVLSTVEMWNPTNNIKVSVSGIFLQGYDDSQDIQTFAIWDREFDSKYYRRTGSDKTFTNGQIISNRQITKFY